MSSIRRAIAFALLALFTLTLLACSPSSSSNVDLEEPAPLADVSRPSTPEPIAVPMREPVQRDSTDSLDAPASEKPAPEVSESPLSAGYAMEQTGATPAPPMSPTARLAMPTNAPAAAGENSGGSISQPASPSLEAAKEAAVESVPAAAQSSSGVASAGASGRAGPRGPVGPAGSPLPTAAASLAARGSGGGQSQPGTTTFRDSPRISAVSTYEDAISTFSLDTDRTSYRLALNWAREGHMIEPDSVRAEEWINSFGYGYGGPWRDDEFAIYTDVFRHPLDGSKHLARVAFQAPVRRDDSKPLNVTLVLDASGSMAEGRRVDIARAAAESIRQSLRPQDRIAIVQFSEDVLGRWTVKHTRPEDRKVSASLDNLQPNNATNVQAGLNLGLKLADKARREWPDAYNYVILMSDGVANVDATNPFAILESAGDYQRQNPIRLVTIGVGIANYNDYLLEQLAQHGNGWYRYLDNPQQAEATFSRDNWLNLAIPFADQTRAQVTWDPEHVRSWRIVGYENRVTADENFTQNRKEFAEIPSGAATTVFYELELAGRVVEKPSSTAGIGNIEVRWVDPVTGESREQHAVVSRLWRQDFDRLSDPLLKLGALVALTADRYSAVQDAYPSDINSVDWELSDLYQRLQGLDKSLGNLTAYNYFRFLLEHMTRYIPEKPVRPRDSGYSP